VYKPKRRRPCKVCGEDLNFWGPDRKGICPTCSTARRESLVLCGGRCKKKHKLREMAPVCFYFEPGQKGGKKHTVYYCTRCLVAARSRASMMEEGQKETLAKAESRRVRARQKKEKGEKNCDVY